MVIFFGKCPVGEGSISLCDQEEASHYLSPFSMFRTLEQRSKEMILGVVMLKRMLIKARSNRKS